MLLHVYRDRKLRLWSSVLYFRRGFVWKQVNKIDKQDNLVNYLHCQGQSDLSIIVDSFPPLGQRSQILGSGLSGCHSSSKLSIGGSLICISFLHKFNVESCNFKFIFVHRYRFIFVLKFIYYWNNKVNLYKIKILILDPLKSV